MALMETTTGDMVEYIKIDLLQDIHTDGENVKRDAKVEAAYQTLTGAPFFGRKTRPFYLRGAPGNGKTTAFKVAAKEVSNMLDMNYVENPGDDYQPNINDYLLFSLDLSGVNSGMEVLGLPAKKMKKMPGGEEVAIMGKLPKAGIEDLGRVGGGIFLLDDFSNATPSVQNTGLAILDERRVGSINLGNITIGVTGNLGAADGTNVSATSNAIATRAQSYNVTDTLEDWIYRTSRQYKDDLGDVGITAFMKRNPTLFQEKNSTRDGSPYCVPRTWTNLLEYLREIVHVHRHHQSVSNGAFVAFPQERFELAAAGQIGTEAAVTLTAYYHEMMTGADPLARQVMENGKLDDEGLADLRRKYSNGTSSEEQGFAYQFMSALADYAANDITKSLAEGDNKKLTTALDSMAEGMYGYEIDEAAISFFSNYLASKLIARSGDDPKVGYLDSEGRPVIAMELLEKMLDSIAKQPAARSKIGEDAKGKDRMLMHSTFVEAITNQDRYQKGSDVVTGVMV